MINSTVSNESAPKSLVKLASLVTSPSSTPNLSTMIEITLDFTSVVFNLISGQMRCSPEV